MNNMRVESSSFRDPSGFVFYDNDILLRQINFSYKENYEHLMNSGLYEELVNSKFLISHEESDFQPSEKGYLVIKPTKIPFISYPYEWSFHQFKAAALRTLEIQKISMNYGMTLKDCSAFNIQFLDSNPVFIDTLSFEKYTEGQIWTPYAQFCQHFLAPLSLMAHKDIRLSKLFTIFFNGIPLDLASSLLPQKTKTMYSLLTHIHAHAKSQKRYGDKKIDFTEQKMPKKSFLGLIDSVYSAVKKLSWNSEDTEWAKYYSDTNYSDAGFKQKSDVVSSWIKKIKPQTVWDIGSNTGQFSRLASSQNSFTVSFDIDPAAVDANFLECKKNNDKSLLPLLLDISNPSPSIGWENKERLSIPERGPVNLILALALVHHLAISNNLPLSKIATYFSSLSDYLIIEFIPKSDSQINRLLVSRKDIFDDYDQENFEKEFSKFFTILDKVSIVDSKRFLYFLQKNKM